MNTLVIGVGSTIRGDDGVGVRVARALTGRCHGPQVDVIEVGTAGLSLLDFIEGYDRLVVIDAAVTGAAPGTVHALKGEDVAKTVHLGPGHEADLPTTLALGRRLSRHMPEEIVVFAVEAADIETFSEQLSPAVGAAIPEVVARVDDLLSRNR